MVREKSGENNKFLRSGNFVKGQGNLRCLLKSVKSQGISFSFRKASFQMIDFDTL